VGVALTGLEAGAFTGFGLDNLAELKDGKSMRSSSSDPNWREGNADARPIPPGESLVIADLEGPGVIRHIWNTIASPEIGHPRLVVVRMYWDGEEEPSVQVPLGDFFGIGHGKNVAYNSLPVSVTSNGRARNCYWPMPFRKSAKITVTNEGQQPVHAFFYYVDWHKVPDLPPDTAYFHAMYRQEHPAESGSNFLIADIEGRGHYVGTVQNVRMRQPSWYGEGDDFFFIDGEEEPSLRGTGTEDYFCDAWGFREMTTPFYGIPLWQGYGTGDLGSVYRWHIADPVIFEKSLRVEIEHKGAVIGEDGQLVSGFMERDDDMSTVAYWYQLEPHKPLEDLPPAYDRLYYDYRQAKQAEAQLEEAVASAGNLSVQEGGAWAGGGQIFWQPESEGAVLHVPFEVAENGTYDMVLWLTHSWNYGIYQIEIDGEPIAEPRDMYSENVEVQEMNALNLGLEAGEHTFTFRNVGKNSESEGYYFGFDAYLFSATN
jgi:hypothetical protein